MKFDDKRLEGAYSVLMSKNLNFVSDEDAESQLLGLQRRFALTDIELKTVGYQAALDLLQRAREDITEEIKQKDEGAIYKAALRAGVEAHLLPLEIKARFKKGTER